MLSPSEIDALPVYSTAQQLKHVRYQRMQMEASFQSGGNAQRNLMKVAYDSLVAQEKDLEQKLAEEQAGDYGGGNVIVTISRA